jgi:cobalt/nickel transport system ATP-binding protein
MDFHNNGNEPIFEVNDISYSYNDQIIALEHVNMVVHQHEILAIVGSNGSGKSTLLKILDGLYFPGTGSVKAFGQIITEQALRNDQFNYEFRKRVGFIFQDSDAQLFMPSVWDEIAFGPLQLGVDPLEVKSRVGGALAALQIEKLKHRSPHQLSGGEKKLVALASIMSLSPEVWMLDEPSAGLDPRSVSWLKEFITNQVKAKRTIIISTHDLSLVEAIANRVYIMDESHKIIAEGTPDQVFSNRSLLKTANLI